jgi:YD repeat-containing protein
VDGSFQYEEGETIRFTIGATYLGEVTGKEEVTPFDLANSPVVTGGDIGWALLEDEDPFQTVVNLTVLLHSLDHDADPGSRIEIRACAAELLAKVKLDLRWRATGLVFAVDPEGESIYVAQDWETFQSDPTLRHILGIADRKNCFSTPHGVVQPGMAIGNLYVTLGIDPRIYGLSFKREENQEDISTDRFEYDHNGNATLHETSDFGGAYETSEYNADGRVIRHEQHADQFNHHRVETWRYDEDGNLIESEITGTDGYVMGEVQEKSTGRYDIDGNRLAWTTIKTRVDDEETEVLRNRYAYDVHERLVQFAEESDFQDADRERHYSERFTYSRDAYGNLRAIELLRTARVLEDDPDAPPEWLETASSQGLEANQFGKVTRYYFDGGKLVYAWSYDSDGKVTEFSWVGVMDWIYRYEYDADRNVTRREFINTRDDVVEEIVTWQYDEIGNVIQKDVWSTSPTGEYYSLETWQYHTDNALKVYEIEETQLSVEAEELEEEKEVRRRGYRYDANGNLLQYEEPGVERKAWEYDAGGKLVREQVEIEAEGRYTQFWEYDAEKIVKRNLVDEGGDGSIDVTTVFQYQPTEWGILFSSTQRPVFLNPRPDVEQLATTGF